CDGSVNEEHVNVPKKKFALTLQQNHGYHVVVLYCHPSSTGGPTVWDFAATPGAATKFISKESPSGKAARDLFKHGMRCLFQNEKASNTESSSVLTETALDTIASCEDITHTTTLDTMASSEDNTETATSDTMASSQVIKETLTTASTGAGQCPSTSSNFDLIAGTVVELTNDDGVVCAEACVTGFNMVHNQQLPPGYLSVLVTSTVSEMQVAPPLPSSFDDTTVEEGGFYAWPLLRIRSK
ncbi:Hypothetical predicted protein, partial [Paramuricea clavata]